MKTPTRLAVCTWVILAACSSADKTKIANITDYKLDGAIPADNSFKQQPAATVLDFLRWYRSNENRLKKIELVTRSKAPDSSRFYVVNFEATEQYLSEMKSSGFISDKYVVNWREYFAKCNANFKKKPQTDSAPEGFEVDFVMWSKDYQEDLTNIEKSKVESLNAANDQATVVIGLPTVGRVKYKITKQADGKWLIDNIKDLRSALDQPQNN